MRLFGHVWKTTVYLPRTSARIFRSGNVYLGIFRFAPNLRESTHGGAIPSGRSEPFNYHINADTQDTYT